jgi:hypothetical protein
MLPLLPHVYAHFGLFFLIFLDCQREGTIFSLALVRLLVAASSTWNKESSEWTKDVCGFPSKRKGKVIHSLFPHEGPGLVYNGGVTVRSKVPSSANI